MMVEVIRSRDNLMWHAPATRDPLTRSAYSLAEYESVSNRAYWAGNSHVKQSFPSGRNERVETAWRDNCDRQSWTIANTAGCAEPTSSSKNSGAALIGEIFVGCHPVERHDFDGWIASR